MSELNNPKLGGGRKTLLLLAVIFVLPFTIAATLHLLNVRPGGKSYGALITPPVSLTIPALQNVQGKPINWQKKWNIIMVERTNCDVTCQATTHLLGNVRLSLDKDTKRVQQVLLLLGTVNADAIADLQKNNPDLLIIAGDGDAYNQFANKLETLAKPQNIYLVDPLGNLMMQYPRNFEPKGLRGDFVRLLKNSWAG
ncbi:MAG: hypothetical protein ACKVOA_01745 [Methylophilaceae bacterium]